MSRFTSSDEITQYVVDALGDYADDFDIDAIIGECFEYRADVNEKGQELLNTAGFELVVSDDEFWQVVERHARAT